MKRLFYLIIILSLPVLVYFQYVKYKRFHPPVDYEYVVNPDIDKEYHDPEVVHRYYQNALGVGSYARYIWRKHRTDVRFASPDDPAEAVYLETYNQTIARARFLEDRLLASAHLKKAGYSNSDIRIMESQGMSEQEFELWKLLKDHPVLKMGDQSSVVWKIQEMLVSLGYVMPIDGLFKWETRDAVKEFQNANKMFPSGSVDDITLKALLEQTRNSTKSN
jgi:murein L,D-transpeptidase YcbB/YkuD